MQIWISIVESEDGIRDVEVLDAEPTESFRDGLHDAFLRGDITNWEIRLGNLNGGDSTVEWACKG